MLYDLNDGMETVTSETETIRDRLAEIEESLVTIDETGSELQKLKDSIYNRIEEANGLLGDIDFNDGEDAVADLLSDVSSILVAVLSDIG